MKTLITFTSMLLTNLAAGAAMAWTGQFSDGAGFVYDNDPGYQQYTEWGDFFGGHIGGALGGIGGGAVGGWQGGAVGGAFGTEFGSAVGQVIGAGAWEIDTWGTLDDIPIEQYPDFTMQ